MAAKISRERIGTFCQTALKVLVDKGGSMGSSELFREIEKRLDLNDYERERYEKSGYIRWESVLHFYSIDCAKAGWLRKNKGIWYVTPEGKEALSLAPREFIDKASEAYKAWTKSRPEEAIDTEAPIEDEDGREVQQSYEKAQEIAKDQIYKHIRGMDPYKMQDMAAALLRAMGYFTPFVAPKGKDGGIDIIAYKDPLGVEGTRVKVQVKHREQNKATVQEIRQLKGLINKEGEAGLFVSTGGFTDDAKKETLHSNPHIEIIDLEQLIELWEDHYDKLEEIDKIIMPLTKISFLTPTD